MKNKLLRILTLIALVAVVMSCLVACRGQAEASDASGDGWTYTKKDKTLTITANAIPSADKPENVAWYAVKSSVEKVIINGSPTSIGDYAFHGMTSLTSITIPKTVTSIGKCAFAFCSSLEEIAFPNQYQETIDVPVKDENGKELTDESGKTITKKETVTKGGLQTIGEGAFECCIDLEILEFPETVKTIGDRAFLSCRDLRMVSMKEKPVSIGAYAFKDCPNLNKFAIKGYTPDNTNPTIQFGEGVFDKSPKMSTGWIEAYKGGVVITVKHVLSSDISVEVAPTETITEKSDGTTFVKGDKYTAKAVTVAGYTVKGAAETTVDIGDENKVITFTYDKSIVATDAPVAESGTATEPVKKPEKDPVVTIITLVIFGIVIVGLIVGVIIFMRSSKKTDKNSTTVRKNTGDGKAKKEKKEKLDKSKYKKK